MHQPLASVYFHCCLKQLNIKLARAGFPFVLGLIRQYDSVGLNSVMSDAEVIQLFVLL